MIFKKGMSLIVTIVNSGFSQTVVDASKKAGVEGATILNGRGNNKDETSKFLGVKIQPEKEMVLILVRKSFRKEVMKEIVRACDLSSEGRGMTFCLPVDEVAGLSLLFKNKRNEEPQKQKTEVEVTPLRTESEKENIEEKQEENKEKKSLDKKEKEEEKVDIAKKEEKTFKKQEEKDDKKQVKPKTTKTKEKTVKTKEQKTSQRKPKTAKKSIKAEEKKATKISKKTLKKEEK